MESSEVLHFRSELLYLLFLPSSCRRWRHLEFRLVGQSLPADEGVGADFEVAHGRIFWIGMLDRSIAQDLSRERAFCYLYLWWFRSKHVVFIIIDLPLNTRLQIVGDNHEFPGALGDEHSSIIPISGFRDLFHLRHFISSLLGGTSRECLFGEANFREPDALRHHRWRTFIFIMRDLLRHLDGHRSGMIIRVQDLSQTLVLKRGFLDWLDRSETLAL